LIPCECNEDIIQCIGNDIINLKHIFDSLSQHLPDEKKHYKKFYLNNTAINEIEENTFFDLTFDEIIIEGTKNLNLINSNAFTETNFVTKSLVIQSIPNLNQSPNHDILHVPNLMKNLVYLVINDVNLDGKRFYSFLTLNKMIRSYN
jgi:hypothetical protein